MNATCARIQERAAEAALGLLNGEDRADVLAHLDVCDDCRDCVAELSSVADALVNLSPEAEPPAGFEARVLDALERDVRPRRRRAVALAAAAAIAVLLAGYGVGRVTDAHSTATREIAMHAPSGKVVGEAYLHHDSPSWVFVAVPDWKDDGNDFRLRITHADGSTSEVDGSGTWAVMVDPSDVRALALIGADGEVWCSATV